MLDTINIRTILLNSNSFPLDILNLSLLSLIYHPNSSNVSNAGITV